MFLTGEKPFLSLRKFTVADDAAFVLQVVILELHMLSLVIELEVTWDSRPSCILVQEKAVLSHLIVRAELQLGIALYPGNQPVLEAVMLLISQQNERRMTI